MPIVHKIAVANQNIDEDQIWLSLAIEECADKITSFLNQMRLGEHTHVNARLKKSKSTQTEHAHHSNPFSMSREVDPI